jgi:hypothetical protein
VNTKAQQLTKISEFPKENGKWPCEIVVAQVDLLYQRVGQNVSDDEKDYIATWCIIYIAARAYPETSIFHSIPY